MQISVAARYVASVTHTTHSVGLFAAREQREGFFLTHGYLEPGWLELYSAPIQAPRGRIAALGGP